MGNHEKAVLSKKNKYYISKHRYYELKHFCLQYNEWIEELKKLDSQGRRSCGGEIHSDPQFSDPTAEVAMRRSQLQQNIEIIKDAAAQTDRVLFNYLIKAVTEERSYVYLREVLSIPCCKDAFYEAYRRFFWVLSKLRR